MNVVLVAHPNLPHAAPCAVPGTRSHHMFVHFVHRDRAALRMLTQAPLEAPRPGTTREGRQPGSLKYVDIGSRGSRVAVCANHCLVAITIVLQVRYVLVPCEKLVRSTVLEDERWYVPSRHTKSCFEVPCTKSLSLVHACLRCVS